MTAVQEYFARAHALQQCAQQRCSRLKALVVGGRLAPAAADARFRVFLLAHMGPRLEGLRAAAEREQRKERLRRGGDAPWW
jgi:hypothetical protein